MRTAKVPASLRIRAVSPEPMLFAYVSAKPRGKFSQRTRYIALLRARACALKGWFDGTSESLFYLDAAHLMELWEI